MSHFQVVSTCPGTSGRLGKLFLPHGEVETPVFMPVGTLGMVKTVTPREVEALGVEMTLTNAYHLYLRPGVDTIVKAGGINKFIGWRKPMITDSGGFQIFSLAGFRKITEEGAEFQSHVDGSRHHLTPESSIQIQRDIGADIMMCFDECPPYPCDPDHARLAMERTTRWAKRCLEASQDYKPGASFLYGIVQGATYQDLRQESAQSLAALDFPGYAIGGLSVGEPKEVLLEVLENTVPFLPTEKPRYLMGVGKPEDMWEGVDRGIDMFDCVLPTRNARNAQIFTFQGKYTIRNSPYKQDFGPLEEGCSCLACRQFSRAYIHHMFRVNELLAQRLATLHNLTFMVRLMKIIRQSLIDGTFQKRKKDFLKIYGNQQETVAT